MNQLALFEPVDTSLRGYLASLGRVEPKPYPGARFAVLPMEGEWVYCEAASVPGLADAGHEAIVMQLEPA